MLKQFVALLISASVGIATFNGYQALFEPHSKDVDDSVITPALPIFRSGSVKDDCRWVAITDALQCFEDPTDSDPYPPTLSSMLLSTGATHLRVSTPISELECNHYVKLSSHHQALESIVFNDQEIDARWVCPTRIIRGQS